MNLRGCVSGLLFAGYQTLLVAGTLALVLASVTVAGALVSLWGVAAAWLGTLAWLAVGTGASSLAHWARRDTPGRLAGSATGFLLVGPAVGALVGGLVVPHAGLLLGSVVVWALGGVVLGALAHTTMAMIGFGLALGCGMSVMVILSPILGPVFDLLEAREEWKSWKSAKSSTPLPLKRPNGRSVRSELASVMSEDDEDSAGFQDGET